MGPGQPRTGDQLELATSLDGIDGPFNLVHSYIVLQHIATDRGESLIDGLLRRLADDGTGVLHVTYRNPCLPPPEIRGLLRTRAKLAWRVVRGLFRPRRVEMQMNEYNLGALYTRLQAAGVRRMFVELTDHSGVQGAMLFFRKEPATLHRF